MTHVFTSHERHAILRALEDRLNDLEMTHSAFPDQVVKDQANALITATKSALKGMQNAESLVAENRKDDRT